MLIDKMMMEDWSNVPVWTMSPSGNRRGFGEVARFRSNSPSFRRRKPSCFFELARFLSNSPGFPLELARFLSNSPGSSRTRQVPLELARFLSNSPGFCRGRRGKAAMPESLPRLGSPPLALRSRHSLADGRWLSFLELSGGWVGHIGQIALALGVFCVLSRRVFRACYATRGQSLCCALVGATGTRAGVTIRARIVRHGPRFAPEIVGVCVHRQGQNTA